VQGLLQDLGVLEAVDALIVSAEVGIEKPGEVIYEAACAELACPPDEVLHVGHDPVRECFHADQAGCTSLLWGEDVMTHGELWGPKHLVLEAAPPV